MKKTLVISFMAIIGIASVILTMNSCKENKGKEEAKALNISVFLDLSDRLVRDNQTPNQTYRDTAIINYLCDYFRQATLGPQILKSTNKIKVFFYPIPAAQEISTIAKGLSVDIGEKKGVDKRKAVDGLKSQFQTNLGHIYDSTIDAKEWVGCDIWDFFSSKKVDAQCIRKDARNILIILTDGYIFHANNKIKEGANAYSYILPQTLTDSMSSLIARRTDTPLDNLEVLMLEVNPYQPQHRDQMEKILGDWFATMGVKKYVIAETDANMTNTETVIKNFLDE